MLPVIAIVGRPNVGKSTLFNALTRTRDALVADQPGLTRDKIWGQGQLGEKPYLLIDTGGLHGEETEISEYITRQALSAVQESDSALFLVDGRAGLTAVDERIAEHLRQFNIPIHLVVNKTENLVSELASAEFYRLGFQTVHTISAAHRRGIKTLIDTVLLSLPTVEEVVPPEVIGIKVAIVGRPNVGKSTLLNRLLGYERVLTFDQPGTTRDSIFVPFERDGQRYTLIDTAGIRRRARVTETIEKFSVIKALQAIADTHVVLLLLDAREGTTDQDAHLLGTVLEQGKALVIAVNKWDGLAPTQRESVRLHLRRKLHFAPFAKIHFISALHGSGVGHLFAAIQTAWQSAHCQISTVRLNQLLRQAVVAHPPPIVKHHRIKLRYIHQGGQHPPVFVIHGNQVDAVPDMYKRYLINTLRDALTLEGTPIQLVFRQGQNPYEGRKNTLTPRQLRKRQRLMRHIKK